ncbi:hypothetical protein BU25DRAFT_462435 [Macroventuria anomochaeta]|uniref:Uncharacterized protein n=1 Tax=Macroventuria anomochaeta TaxID=301207 RepID=A0ACB6RPJ8_9PLEO|nr:uncharacterized protein BU25DRAFT_462435 [Macroventuria anomochaeta]KAF2623048.1 hypothetical protein BU25DRAFT_462435 [Macroventuria anomochaeta]
MARKVCNHPVFPSLRAKLTALKITVCPTCLIRLHIFDIAETQAGLERRGGVFSSRATAVAEEGRGRKQERIAHRALLRRWRLAKIDLYRDLCLLETLRAEGAGKTRWEIQLAKAFELWKEVELECSRIPGYRYAEENHEDIANEDESVIEQDAELEDRLNEDTIDETRDDDDGGWQTIKPRGKAAKQSPNDTELSEASSTSIQENTMADDNTYYGPNLDVQDPDEVALQGMDSVKLRIERGSYWDGRNRFDLLREIEVDEDPDSPDPLEVHTASQVSTCPRDVDRITMPDKPLLPPPVSSLKRKRSCRPPDNLRLPKEVRMDDRVTIICDYYARHTTGLPPEQTSYKRPHFSYTTAETARRRLKFYRRSPLYVPSTWALPVECENINTSHYKTAWKVYDAMQLLADMEDSGQNQAEIMARLEAAGYTVASNVGELDEIGYDGYYAIPITVSEVKPTPHAERTFSEPESNR